MEPLDKQKKFEDIFEDTHKSEREKYFYYTQNDPDALALKNKVVKSVTQRGLGSVMNDTKWLELQSAVGRLPFPPPYVEKRVLDASTFEEVIIADNPQFVGDWSPFYQEGMSLFFAIEYIKVRPRFATYQGRLVAPEIRDATKEFEEILRELHIPFEEEEGTFIIYGYR